MIMTTSARFGAPGGTSTRHTTLELGIGGAEEWARCLARRDHRIRAHRVRWAAAGWQAGVLDFIDGPFP